MRDRGSVNYARCLHDGRPSGGQHECSRREYGGGPSAWLDLVDEVEEDGANRMLGMGTRCCGADTCALSSRELRIRGTDIH